MSKDISVVIATYNQKERLRLVLRGLAGQTVPLARFEVIVVLDGCADGTEAVVEGANPRLAARMAAERIRGPPWQHRRRPYGVGAPTHTSGRAPTERAGPIRSPHCTGYPTTPRKEVPPWIGSRPCSARSPLCFPQPR
ncbi:MAG: glycosyltransferase [Candidatus Latescibacterota bacterium]